VGSRNRTHLNGRNGPNYQEQGRDGAIVVRSAMLSEPTLEAARDTIALQTPRWHHFVSVVTDWSPRASREIWYPCYIASPSFRQLLF
jgi:hypothetical protein